MIVFERVSKVYPGGQPAIRDLSLHIRKGEFVFVEGRSGAGKSTFLKLILREEKATSGRIQVAGMDLSTLRERDVPYLRRNMGVVFQDFRLIPTMSAYENVAFALRVLNVPERQIAQRVPHALRLVGLETRMERLPEQLSGGEQQRVALARALVPSPQLIIADEPTGNIDPELTPEIMRLLETINRTGITVVVVTHEQELASRFGKRTLLLDRGVLVEDRPAPYAKGVGV